MCCLAKGKDDLIAIGQTVLSELEKVVNGTIQRLPSGEETLPNINDYKALTIREIVSKTLSNESIVKSRKLHSVFKAALERHNVPSYFDSHRHSQVYPTFELKQLKKRPQKAMSNNADELDQIELELSQVSTN